MYTCTLWGPNVHAIIVIPVDFLCPQWGNKLINHTEWSVLKIWNSRKFSVRGKFRCRVGVGRYKIQFVQYKNHYAYAMSPYNMETSVCVCVRVCVCLCVEVSLMQLPRQLHTRNLCLATTHTTILCKIQWSNESLEWAGFYDITTSGKPLTNRACVL